MRGPHRVQCAIRLHPGSGPVGESAPQEVEVEEERLETPGLAEGEQAAPFVGSQGLLELQEEVQTTLLASPELQE